MMGSVSLKPGEHNNFSKQRRMQPEAGQPLPLPLPQRGPQQPWPSQRMPVISGWLGVMPGLGSALQQACRYCRRASKMQAGRDSGGTSIRGKGKMSGGPCESIV